MTIRNQYVLIGIMAVLLLWVFYNSHTTDRRMDGHEKELKSLQDSVTGIHQSRKADSIRVVTLQTSIDSIRSLKPVIINRTIREKAVINSASADSLATIVRSGLSEVQR